MNFLCIVIAMQIISVTASPRKKNTILDFEDDLKDCTNEEERAGYFDLKELNIYVADDLKSYLNGTWKFLKDVNSPWHWLTIVEEFKRGAWVPWIIRRNIPDWCAVMHSSSEVWYGIYKDQPGCPIKAGVR